MKELARLIAFIVAIGTFLLFALVAVIELVFDHSLFVALLAGVVGLIAALVFSLATYYSIVVAWRITDRLLYALGKLMR